MKKGLLFFVLFILSVKGFTQDSTFLSNWAKLKSAYLANTEAAKNISIIAKDCKSVPNVTIDRATASFLVINQVIQITKVPDKISVERIIQFKDSLDLYINIILKSIESDKQFPLLKTYIEFKEAFTSSEKKLLIAKYDFNTVCKKLRMTELIFPIKVDSQVSFD